MSRKVIFEFICFKIPDLIEWAEPECYECEKGSVLDGTYFDGVILARTDHHSRIRAPCETVYWTNMTTKCRHELTHSP